MTETGMDLDMRDLRARIIVLETIQSQMLIAVARLSGAPEALFKGLMRAAEETLHASAATADVEDDRQRAADAINSFNDRSMRLIAALTPNTAQN